MTETKEFQSGIKQNWCPGCGHFAVQSALQRALGNLGLAPHHVAVVSGIGCSGRISGYIRAYGFHGIHGRSLPLAQGIKLANRELTVIATGGDGDGFAIGLGHTLHAIRRNLDMTYIVMDNSVYGLTKGQASPRSQEGFQTKTSPAGTFVPPMSILEMALAAGATFLGQGFSQETSQLTNLIEQGINHKGFSFINVLSPCVTFNKHNNYDWYKNILIKVESLESYDNAELGQAMQAILKHQGKLTGLLYHDTRSISYQDLLDGYSKAPLLTSNLKLEQIEFEKLLEEFY